MQIFLIGFMGSGKTTVGWQLAQKLGISFLDSDREIERRTGQAIAEIFTERGEAHFRALEKEFIFGLTAEPIVVACGGGLPCFNSLLKALKHRGKVVYLETDIRALVRNLKGRQLHRPLLADLSGAELERAVSERLEMRRSTYEQADLHIRTADKTVTAIVDEIAAAMS